LLRAEYSTQRLPALHRLFAASLPATRLPLYVRADDIICAWMLSLVHALQTFSADIKRDNFFCGAYTLRLAKGRVSTLPIAPAAEESNRSHEEVAR
jgi:hypothetical protein